MQAKTADCIQPYHPCLFLFQYNSVRPLSAYTERRDGIKGNVSSRPGQPISMVITFSGLRSLLNEPDWSSPTPKPPTRWPWTFRDLLATSSSSENPYSIGQNQENFLLLLWISSCHWRPLYNPGFVLSASSSVVWRIIKRWRRMVGIFWEGQSDESHASSNQPTQLV